MRAPGSRRCCDHSYHGQKHQGANDPRQVSWFRLFLDCWRLIRIHKEKLHTLGKLHITDCCQLYLPQLSEWHEPFRKQLVQKRGDIYQKDLFIRPTCSFLRTLYQFIPSVVSWDVRIECNTQRTAVLHDSLKCIVRYTLIERPGFVAAIIADVKFNLCALF